MTTYSYDNILGDYSARITERKPVERMFYEPEPGVQLCTPMQPESFMSEYSGSGLDPSSLPVQNVAGHYDYSRIRQRQKNVVNIRHVGNLMDRRAIRNSSHNAAWQRRTQSASELKQNNQM